MIRNHLNDIQKQLDDIERQISSLESRKERVRKGYRMTVAAFVACFFAMLAAFVPEPYQLGSNVLMVLFMSYATYHGFQMLNQMKSALDQVDDLPDPRKPEKREDHATSD